jgi:ribosomal-protein-alanine N-acetyltransferase
VRLDDEELQLRPLRMRDARAWRQLRERNAEWLRPWEATLPKPDPTTPVTYSAMIRQGNREARAGRALPFGIVVDGELVGQITVAGIAWSSLRTCHIGYWIDQGHAGRNLMPRSVALLGDFLFRELQLHRIEINIRPENAASLAVVRKLGFRNEGLRERYLHIDGRWCDHLSFALTAEERPEGLRQWLRKQELAGREARQVVEGVPERGRPPAGPPSPGGRRSGDTLQT